MHTRRYITEMITLTADGRQIRGKVKLRVLGMWLQNNGKKDSTRQALTERRNQICGMVRRITTKRKALKEGDAFKIVITFIISRLTYSLYFHKQNREEVNRVDAQIRKGRQIPLGLPPATSTQILTELGLFITYNEYREAILFSEEPRLRQLKARRLLLTRLGYEEVRRKTESSLDIPRQITKNVMINPIPKA